MIFKKVMTSVSTFTIITGMLLSSTAMAATDDQHQNIDHHHKNDHSRNNDHKKKSLVALGDSITFGYNLGDNNNNSFPSKSAFPYLIGSDKGYNVTDLGIPGWTSTDLLNSLRSDTAQSIEFRNSISKANVITLDIGSNDLLSIASKYHLFSSPNPTVTADEMNEFGSAIQQFKSNLPSIIKEIRELNKHSKIVVYNLYDPIPNSTSTLFNLSESLIQQENTIINSVVNARESHLRLADAYDAFNFNQVTLVRVQYQDVHPTILGQEVLAKIGEAALKNKNDE